MTSPACKPAQILACSFATICFLGLAAKESRCGECQAVGNEQVHKLVESLASGNPWPKYTPDRRYLVFPADFDWDSYQRVREAIDALMELGAEAFPELIAHADDASFCCVTQGLVVSRRWSVGKMCEWIIQRQVAGYDYELAYQKDHHVPSVLPGGFFADSKQSLAEWWRQNQNRTLLEMQVAAAEYALEQTKNRVPSSVGTGEAERRQRNIRRLEQLVAELEDSHEPKQWKGLGVGSRIVPTRPAGDRVGHEVRLPQSK